MIENVPVSDDSMLDRLSACSATVKKSELYSHLVHPRLKLYSVSGA